jgi:hypothetical protein
MTVLRGEGHPRARVQESDVAQMRHRYANSRITMRSIGRLYGITSSASVWNLLNGDTWAHVIPRNWRDAQLMPIPEEET